MIKIRKLQIDDFEGYTNLIESSISKINYERFLQNILNENHIIVVLLDGDEIIGSGTLIIEHKMTYGGCKMGHIENIFVSKNHRKKGHGETIVKYLIDYSNESGCYRVDLNCNSELQNFYEKNNFKCNCICMNIYFKNNFKN